MKNNKVKIRCKAVAVGDTVEEAIERTIALLKDLLDAAQDCTIVTDYHRWNAENEGEVDWRPYVTQFSKGGSRGGKSKPISRATMDLKNHESEDVRA